MAPKPDAKGMESKRSAVSGQRSEAERERKMNQTPCPRCGGSRLTKGLGLHGFGEIAVFVFLLMLGIIPGVVFYFYMRSVLYCESCRRRVGLFV